MENVEKKFSKNDLYLIKEYQKYGKSDFLSADIAGKTFVVPYKYTRSAKTSDDAIFLFKRDLLDFEVAEKEKYLKAGEVPFELNCGAETHIVPYDIKEKSFSIENFLEYIAQKSLIKYNAVIDSHRKLTDLGIEKMPAAFSGVAVAKYLYRLKQYNKNAERAVAKEEKSEKSTLKNVKSADKDVVKERSKSLKDYLTNKYKTALVTAAIVGGGTLGAGLLTQQADEPEKKPITRTETVKKEEAKIYTDYLGKEHSDKYGNLARLKALKPEIMTVIYAIEGFSENTFSDGHIQRGKKRVLKRTRKTAKTAAKGTPTVGSGFTVLYDEQGNKRAVCEGERLTFEDDVVYNTRYIDMELVPVLGDSVGRSLSNEELLCSIGLGYCWGTKGFKSSEYYKSLRKNESVDVLGRKISGWRTPVGILKRAYLCEQVLKGHWSAQDLLDLPVYLVKDKGFVHCSIYTLDFHWYMPCKKDRKGNFIKDKKGNDVPKVMKDDFCEKFYADSDKKILNKLKNMASQGKAVYKTVRHFMTEELLAEMDKRDKDKTEKLTLWEWPLHAQWQQGNKKGR